MGRHSHYCDRQLVEGLLLDAEITNAFSDGLFRSTVLDPLGVSLVFVATRTGLTRSGPMHRDVMLRLYDNFIHGLFVGLGNVFPFRWEERKAAEEDEDYKDLDHPGNP